MRREEGGERRWEKGGGRGRTGIHFVEESFKLGSKEVEQESRPRGREEGRREGGQEYSNSV
jgi:hypothetical protein